MYCISEISGPGMKKRNGIKVVFSNLLFSLVTGNKNSHKETQKILKQNTLSSA